MRFSTTVVALTIAAAAAYPAVAAPVYEARDTTAVDPSGALNIGSIFKTAASLLSNLKREEIEDLLARADDEESGAFSFSKFLAGIDFKRDDTDTDESGAFSFSKFLAGIDFKREDLEDLVAREPFGPQGGRGGFSGGQFHRFGSRDTTDASGAFSISDVLSKVGSFLGLKRHEIDAIMMAREYDDLLAREPRHGGQGGQGGPRQGGRKGGRGPRRGGRKGGAKRPSRKGGFRKGAKGGSAGTAHAAVKPPTAAAVTAPKRSLYELD